MGLKRSKWLMMIAVCMACINLFVSQISAATVEFSDVPKGKPYASAVYELAERNIIGGYEDGTFKPEASITRGQAASIIAKLLKLDTKNVEDPGFKDVTPKLWSYGAIAAVAEKGIFRGYEDGRFGPNDKINRAQMASILIKAFEFNYYTYSYQATPFKDIERLGSHQDAVYTLYELGITSGTSPTTFSPNHPISRSQAAVLISKTEKVRKTTITLHARDFGWTSFGYDDYHNRFLAPEQNEEAVVKVIQHKNAAALLQIVPMKEGTQKLALGGRTKDNTSEDGKKYYVHVVKENGQLNIKFEETEDVLPTNVRLDVAKEPIKKVSLATMDGITINENIAFKTCGEYYDFNRICLTLNEPGEYIATVQYANGKKVRYGMNATVKPSDFYLNTYSIEEIPTVTIDLSKDKGDFREYKIPDSDTSKVKITREGNSDKFRIEGLSEGNIFVDFPNSDRNKEGILGLNIHVLKIGSIIHVEVEPYDYYDQFY